jgi:hypothetical protein
MAKQGFKQHDEWCADFVASVQVARGLKRSDLPNKVALADAWHSWGTKVTGAPQTGDVAARWAHFHGHGHLVSVRSYDPKTGLVTIAQGNPARQYQMPLKKFATQYDIRHMDVPKEVQTATTNKPAVVATPRPTGDATPRPTAAVKAADIPAANRMAKGGVVVGRLTYWRERLGRKQLFHSRERPTEAAIAWQRLGDQLVANLLRQHY